MVGIVKSSPCMPGPEVINFFSFFLLINVKMPTILTFIGRKNSFLGLDDPNKNAEFLDIFILMSF